MKYYTNTEIKKRLAAKEKRHRIFTFIWIPFVVLVLALAATIFYQKIIEKRDLINIFGRTPLIVMTGSMEDNIHAGDVVIVGPATEKELEVGDIITFYSEDGVSTITHRIVDVVMEGDTPMYQTKGDFNTSVDSTLVSYYRVIGHVTCVIKSGGTILTFIFTDIGLYVIIGIILVYYVVMSSRRTRIEARSELRKRHNAPKYEEKEKKHE